MTQTATTPNLPVVHPSLPAEFSEVIRNDMARWGKLIRSMGQAK